MIRVGEDLSDFGNCSEKPTKLMEMVSVLLRRSRGRRIRIGAITLPTFWFRPKGFIFFFFITGWSIKDFYHGLFLSLYNRSVLSSLPVLANILISSR
jgi:hypothetical protein